MNEPEKYVTYKWLIGTTLSILGIVMMVLAGMSSLVTRSLDLKVDQKVYAAERAGLCQDVDEIKRAVAENAKIMGSVQRNQELVLRHLKIEPVR